MLQHVDLKSVFALSELPPAPVLQIYNSYVNFNYPCPKTGFRVFFRIMIVGIGIKCPFCNDVFVWYKEDHNFLFSKAIVLNKEVHSRSEANLSKEM